MAEAQPLAHEMQAAFARRVAAHMRACEASLQEALAAAGRPLTPQEQERLLRDYPHGADWYDLERLADRDPDLVVQKWEGIKQAAREELKSGLRAAEALGGKPWERAQFVAIRQALVSQWQPRGGLEWQLIDTLALAQSSWMYWLNAMTMYAGLDGLMDTGRDTKGLSGPAALPRVSAAQAIELAAGLADRFDKIALRTLRALCGLRRCSPTVFVQTAGQVNIARRQVNVAGPRVAADGPAC
jgi:hypothetical protein